MSPASTARCVSLVLAAGVLVTVAGTRSIAAPPLAKVATGCPAGFVTPERLASEQARERRAVINGLRSAAGPEADRTVGRLPRAQCARARRRVADRPDRIGPPRARRPAGGPRRRVRGGRPRPRADGGGHAARVGRDLGAGRQGAADRRRPALRRGQRPGPGRPQRARGRLRLRRGGRPAVRRRGRGRRVALRRPRAQLALDRRRAADAGGRRDRLRRRHARDRDRRQRVRRRRDVRRARRVPLHRRRGELAARDRRARAA